MTKIIGTGIDIIEIDRIQQAIKRWDKGFIDHVFTKAEIAYALKNRFPAQHFAARFAAKEAVVKALGDTENIRWHDIEISNAPNGKPQCKLKKRNFKHKIFLSISHSKNYAVASALITS